MNQLDSMLGNLQSDMSRQGVATVSKGVCAACSKPIVGQVCTALGRTWHPEHFTCAVCEVPLGTKTFFERDGKPYCEEDYHEQFAPRCAYCEGPILDVSRLLSQTINNYLLKLKNFMRASFFARPLGSCPLAPSQWTRVQKTLRPNSTIIFKFHHLFPLF